MGYKQRIERRCLIWYLSWISIQIYDITMNVFIQFNAKIDTIKNNNKKYVNKRV